MLDTTTKRRIDTARDILVGKVPDPKSQVEQITIALIYKFMEDMDLQAEELGGNKAFFSGDFERYSWSRLIRSGLGGHEVLSLYADAIQKMPENPNIPELFRSIFRNAFLPYRDPETLRAFLKIIDEFEYDHSEKLGDAFEYLLSVLGSQGDAGQFRTPRHIIDFIVEVVNPQKTDVILDPACGTAGFLISAYKHIQRLNSSDFESKNPSGNLLGHSDRELLAQNMRGYDISPDMVRLSLVNLYLHGFASPQIVEYDTLTSDERWNEYADVILANPPFMSPTGGIRPHNRFGIQSKRSEVLFVDYILEHLTSGGRAGVIVPEGIIFQSQTAYRSLRKKLVEEDLIAVISLPPGVFNPYSGVKTSVLILDKGLAKQSSTIGFFKVDHDGFSLGAQRREGGPNDLPIVIEQVAQYRELLREGDSGLELESSHGLIVEKERIAADDDFNLSGERYRVTAPSNFEHPMVSLGNERIFRIESGGTPSSSVPEYWDGNVAWATLADLPATDIVSEISATKRTLSEQGLRSSSAKLLPENSVLVSSRATIGRIGISRIPLATNQGFKNIVIANPDLAIPEFVAHVLVKLRPVMESRATGGTFKEISKTQFSQLEIPLPPVNLQREIVAEILGYQKVINGARAVVENYRPQIAVNPSWPVSQLGEIATINPRKSELSSVPGDTQVSFVPMADLGENEMQFQARDTRRLDEVTSSYSYFRDKDVLLAKVTPCFENGKAGIARKLTNGLGFGSSEFYVIRCSEKVLPEIVYLYVTSAGFRTEAISKMTGTGGLQRIPRAMVEERSISIPPLVVQHDIVAEIQAERQTIEGNKKLIERMQQKIDAAIARVWGESGSSN